MEDRPLEEQELVERARSGDVGAYEQLVRRYQDLAVRVAHVVGGSAAEAQDAAQEAFVKAFAALGRFRAGAPFRPWLLRIVSNEAITRARASGCPSAISSRPSNSQKKSPSSSSRPPAFFHPSRTTTTPVTTTITKFMRPA